MGKLTGFFKWLLKYGYIWRKKSTTDELKEEREPLRLRAIQGDEFARKLMDMIDNELISRANDEFRKNNPDAEARHTEHGYTLPEDDD